MSTVIRASILVLLALVAGKQVQGQAVLDSDGAIAQVDVLGDRGAVSIEAKGLPPSASFRAFVAARGAWTSASSQRVSNPGDAFFQPAFVTQSVDWWSSDHAIAGVFAAKSADGSPVDLRIRNELGRVFCRQRSAGAAATARCFVRIPHDDIPIDPLTGRRRMTLLVEAEARGTRDTQVEVGGFFSNADLATDDLELQSGLATDSRGDASLVMPYSIRLNRVGAPEAFLLSFQDDKGSKHRDGVVLVNRDRREPSASLALVGGEGDDALAANTSHVELVEHRRLVFLVPGNAGRIDIRASTSAFFPSGTRHSDGTPQDLELSLHRWSRDPSGSDVVALPAGEAAQYVVNREGPVAWPAATSESLSLDGQSMEPGLWYAVPRSRTGIPLNVRFNVDFGPAARPLTPRTGHYFNAARPGHGIVLAPTGNDWVLIWYTYDADGSPTWYYAQAPKPNLQSGGSQWLATLYRNVWNGTGTRFQFAGLVQIAALTPDRLVLAHLLNGQLGVEPMVRLGDGRCAQRWEGAPLDVNGLWFAPTKPGFGYSIEFIGNTEFYLAYAYDAAGLPRWVTAQQTEGANTMPLWQRRGACPSCAPAVSTFEIVGTLGRTFGASAAPDGKPGFLSLAMDARFLGGPTGRWAEDRPASLLSRRAGCE